MPCTEVALLRLISPSCRDELEKSPVHSAALKTVSSQPGFLSCTWGVLAEDNTLLVWLVEWEALEDHTEQFMQSRDYPAFNRSLSSILHADKPVFSMSHFTFAQSPSRLASLSRGTLEVFQVLLRSVDDHAAFAQAWRPNLDKWTTQDRPNVMAAALDEDQKDKAMLLVAWESVKEHMDAKKTETYAGAIKEARTLFKETSPIALFGHIQPAVVMPSS